MRRLLLALAGFRLAETATWVALTAFAFERGGVREAALVMLAQLAPSAAFALGVGGLIERYGAVAVLRAGLVTQAVAFACVAAALFTDAPVGLVYVPAVIGAVAITSSRPALAVLTPACVTAPVELSAANVLGGWLGALASLVGPISVALLVRVASYGWHA